MKILVTGGAGFIGSHFCKVAKAAGFDPITYDNLSTGHKEHVKFGHLVVGDIRDEEKLFQTIKNRQISAVVHFAAKALVGESMEHPDLYYSNNTGGTASLLSAMDRAKVRTLLFSSSCATYGVSESPLISEKHQQLPINPYGRSKLQCEEMILDYHKLKNFKVGMLRYFNVAGQAPDGTLAEMHEPETHVIPNILKALEEKREFNIFGTDYPTPDGTCVRDYVYVWDLANVHLAALNELSKRDLLISNVGSGRGYSVREVFSAFEAVFGRAPQVKECPRRPGDPARLVADPTFFRTWYRESLGDLQTMIGTLKK